MGRVVRLDQLPPAVAEKVRAMAGKGGRKGGRKRVAKRGPTKAQVRAALAAKAVPLSGRGGAVTLTIYGAPRTKKNSPEIRKSGDRRWISASPHYRKWAGKAVAQIREMELAPINEPVNICALIYRDRRVGDADNYYAAIGDVLETAGLLVNDGMIESWDGSRRLFDKRNPRVELCITRADLSMLAYDNAA